MSIFMEEKFKTRKLKFKKVDLNQFDLASILCLSGIIWYIFMVNWDGFF